MRHRGAGVIFFSSRRRHTRYWRDWSSDVCSSDLSQSTARMKASQRAPTCSRAAASITESGTFLQQRVEVLDGAHRSEERRVGKECRSRRSPYHYKKKDSDSAFTLQRA